jgi:hypothetical protein
VKRYHPDLDNSLDAQAKYREIRAAYDVLRNRPYPKFSNQNFEDLYKGYRMGGQTGWKVRDEDNASRFFDEWEWNSPQQPTPKVRRPFSWGALPGVIWESADEIAGMTALIRSTVTSYLLWWVTSPVSNILAFVTIFLSLCGAAIFRYYYTRAPEDKGVYFLASLYYGLGMSAAFVACSLVFGKQMDFPLMTFLYHILVFYTVILPLWIQPLALTAPDAGKHF